METCRKKQTDRQTEKPTDREKGYSHRPVPKHAYTNNKTKNQMVGCQLVPRLHEQAPWLYMANMVFNNIKHASIHPSIYPTNQIAVVMVNGWCGRKK